MTKDKTIEQRALETHRKAFTTTPTVVWFMVSPSGAAQIAHGAPTETGAWLSLLAGSASWVAVDKIPATLDRWKGEGWTSQAFEMHPASGNSIRVEWRAAAPKDATLEAEDD